MKISCALAFVCLGPSLFAQQAPWGRPDIPISSHDRVYAADQTSNTVSVIDPSSNRLLGVIRLGDPAPGALAPLYRGELLVHGLGYAPDANTCRSVDSHKFGNADRHGDKQSEGHRLRRPGTTRSIFHARWT
jgi:YVTN family beta-propeller protein